MRTADHSDPIEAILFKMKQMGHNQTEAALAAGIRLPRFNEILNKRRALSVVQIRKLQKYGVPPHVLIQEYVLHRKK